MPLIILALYGLAALIEHLWIWIKPSPPPPTKEHIDKVLEMNDPNRRMRK